jgi:hypothetical protein
MGKTSRRQRTEKTDIPVQTNEGLPSAGMLVRTDKLLCSDTTAGKCTAEEFSDLDDLWSAFGTGDVSMTIEHAQNL